INNSDIESITVIKDAAAASLYGSRAANGVILITTKTGKGGKAVFNFKTDWGFSDYSTPFIPTMSGEERREAFKEAFYNQAVYLKSLSGADAQKFVDDNIEASAPIPWNGWADWESALFRKQAPFQNYDLSASGGDDKISYFSSLGYTDEKGLTYQQDFSRISGRVNVKYKFNKRLELGANILYSTISQDVNSEGGTYTSPIYSSRHKVSASDPIYKEDGSYNQNLLSNGVRNPKMAADMNYKRQKARRSFNTISANYKIIDGLAFNTAFSLDNTYTEYKSWTDPRSSDGASSNGSISASLYRYDQIVWRNSLNYVKSFAQKHNLDVLAGYETHEYSRYSLSGSVSDFPTIDKQEISNGAAITDLSGSTSGWRLLSYLSRANYNYGNKYFLGISARMDGSSRLHRDSRWGTFWSVSGAWKISEELFAEAWKPVLSDLKLRASFGSNGTLPSDYYGYMDLVKFGSSYMSKPAILESQIGNKDLSWEKNYNLNVGVDFKLFNRINTTVELYNRNTSDLLLDMPISLTTGFSSILTNIGRVQNKGVEVEIDADIIKTREGFWNSSLNFGSNKNEVKDLGGQEEIKSGAYTHKIGKPYYSFYVIEFAGINPETGVPQFYVNGEDDDSKNKKITEDYAEANYVVYKSAEPTLTGGWSNQLKYKIFDFNFTFTYSLGGYSYDRAASKLETSGNNTLDNIQALYKDRWKQPGDITSIEKFMVGSSYDMSKVTSSRRIHSTDHLRLKNVILGVSVPKHLVRSAGLSNVRLYFSAVNLWTLAAYDRYDPELQSNGDFYFESPKLKTLTFGLDIKF
ncbi:MAG: SusC/RagA family TonB-linked outer membrane protein, partial [Mediterranea sp.]|nr:SusC/RagA family TonB-linked outer membrane protein [Mediterranea sp.]